MLISDRKLRAYREKPACCNNFTGSGSTVFAVAHCTMSSTPRR
jgi:hypothetical protein